MTKSTITREQLEEWVAQFDEDGGCDATDRQLEALIRQSLAAMDRDQVRNEHAKWSQATFGNVGPVGPLKHLSKEALEAAAEPGDLSEWADMQFLLWDAQRRAGITDEQITQAMIEKLAVNKQRKWPAPKDGEPRLHIKEQPAPVVPLPDVVSVLLNHLEDVLPDDAFNLIDVKAWNAVSMLTCPDACRAAMLQAGDTVRDLSTPVDPQIAEYEQNVMQDGNSPVIPDSARDALEKALAAMEFMGDTLNNLDAVCTEDVELVAPAFDAVRSVLAAALKEGK